MKLHKQIKKICVTKSPEKVANAALWMIDFVSQDLTDKDKMRLAEACLSAVYQGAKITLVREPASPTKH
jgi:hypothetical protein